MKTQVDYSQISELTFSCDDVIHKLEHATQKTIGNIRGPADTLVRTVTEFLNAPEADVLRSKFVNSMRILAQRRDDLARLLSRDKQKSTRSRRLTNGKAKRFGVRL
ncbi:MAG: hypothetical protein K8Q97_01530 [Candidatus Andersenbacteria bacterium]|nr:hypothetical protein [Candidatus Andersenbacteria bacterium]